MEEINITADYASITCVADICHEWIQLWDGDEWGYSMMHLHGACHTSYGFTDEDCALFASKLLENLMAMRAWMDEEGISHGLTSPEDEAPVAERCRERRAYWSKGGNLTGHEHSIKTATETLETLPGWMFGEKQ